MSTTGYSLSVSAIRAQMNSAFDLRELVRYINWHPEKMVRSGDVYLALCPIHRDTLFRSLELNPRNNTYHCSNNTCPGNQPADCIDLLCKSLDQSAPAAMMGAIRHFGAEFFRLHKEQVAVLERMVEGDTSD